MVQQPPDLSMINWHSSHICKNMLSPPTVNGKRRHVILEYSAALNRPKSSKYVFICKPTENKNCYTSMPWLYIILDPILINDRVIRDWWINMSGTITSLIEKTEDKPKASPLILAWLAGTFGQSWLCCVWWWEACLGPGVIHRIRYLWLPGMGSPGLYD